MIRTVVVYAGLSAWGAVAVAEEPAPALVEFASPESMARLARSQHKVDFFHLANHFEGQINGGYCGPATAVVVLNALRVDNDKIEKPRDTSTVPAEYVNLIPKQF